MARVGMGSPCFPSSFAATNSSVPRGQNREVEQPLATQGAGNPAHPRAMQGTENNNNNSNSITKVVSSQKLRMFTK